MENNGLALRGWIFAKFKTCADFADALGWSKQKLSFIMTGKRIPTLKDVWSMADLLGQPFDSVAKFFLPNESPDGDN